MKVEFIYNALQRDYTKTSKKWLLYGGGYLIEVAVRVGSTVCIYRPTLKRSDFHLYGRFQMELISRRLYTSIIITMPIHTSSSCKLTRKSN